jgi:outer membrane protein TolC
MESKASNFKDRSMTNGMRTGGTLLFLVLLFSEMLGVSLEAFAADSVSVAPAVTLTLPKAIEMALDRNRDVLMMGQARERAHAQVREAWSNALPRVSASGDYTRNVQLPVMFMPANSALNPTSSTQSIEIGSNNAYQVTASLTQPLYNRKVGVALKIAGTYERYADQAFQATAEDVVRNTTKAFYGVMLARELVEVNRQGLEVVKANLDNVRSLYEHGSAAEYDLLRAEVQYANTEPLLIMAENNHELATNSLKALLAIPLDQDLVLEGAFEFQEVSPADMETERENAITRNPSLAQLALQESLATQNIAVVKADYFPSLSLVGSYSWLTQDNSYEVNHYKWANTLAVGLHLSYTLFDGLATRSRVAQANSDRSQIHYLRLKSEEGLRIQIHSAESQMEEARKRIEAQLKSLSQAQKALQISQTRYKSGIGTQLELLDTQVAMTHAQTNYSQAIYDYLTAKADWQYYVGNLR